MAEFRYVSALSLASVVAAYSLVQDSVEGVVASMLISPIGVPVMAFVEMAAEGRSLDAAAHAAILCASFVALFAVGFGVRALSRTSRPPSVTGEMRKRMATFDTARVFVYAATIGAAMAVVSASGGDAVASTGLAIAVSILPPVVNSGVLVYDSVSASRANDSAKSTSLRQAAVTSASLAGVNVLGVVVGAAAAAVNLSGVYR